MRFTRREVGVLSLGTIVAAVSAAEAAAQPAADPPATAGPETRTGQAFLECSGSIWKGEPNATRAVLELNARPKERFRVLKERMKPLKIDAERMKLLLTRLGSKDEAEWKPAFEELEYLDPRLAIGLETPTDEVRDAGPPAPGSGHERSTSRLDRRETGRSEGPAADSNFFSQPIGSWWAEAEVKLINSTPGAISRASGQEPSAPSRCSRISGLSRGRVHLETHEPGP